MKRIPESVLTAAALAKGATVKVDGKAINAAGQRADVPRVRLLPRPTTPPAPVPEPPPPPPATLDTSGLERIAEAGQRSTQQLLQLVAMLVQEMRAGHNNTQAPAQRHGWSFEVQRDGNGRMTNIKARPLAQGE